jgi:hypothetical protein
MPTIKYKNMKKTEKGKIKKDDLPPPSAPSGSKKSK